METILDLQHEKLLIVLLKKLMISWLRHGLSCNSQILGRTSVCQVSLGRGGGGIQFSSVIENQKSPANPCGTIVYNCPCYVRRRGLLLFICRSVTRTALSGRWGRGGGIKRKVWELNGLVTRSELSVLCSQTFSTYLRAGYHLIDGLGRAKHRVGYH